jgi:toxin-antitoxin system PIN domain toxin
VIAVDTNVLVHAHRADSPWFAPAAAAVSGLANGRASWAIPWPCIHEFIAVVTHQRIFKTATPLARACEQVDAWMESPALVLVSESAAYWPTLRELSLNGQVSGPRIHDARIASLCQANGVSLLLTADRDFSRYPGLATRNPLVATE